MQKHRWIIILMVSLAMCIVATGCSIRQRVKMAERAPSELVGLAKTDLLSCAGVPVRSEKIDDFEFLTYTSGNTREFFCRSGRYCEVTFTLKNNIVEKVTYAGNTGGPFSQGEQCAYVIAPCLKDKN
ncbi:MAG: hypothetical protein ABIK15_13895 [Pseudomonadota bacterium]